MGAAYHFRELAIARDPTDPAHCLPKMPLPGTRVLDIGCGAGQTLIALGLAGVGCGVDRDTEALHLGRQWSPALRLSAATAEKLPFASGAFDFVMARVSLPATNVPTSLREARRVLKLGGVFWMVLHPARIPWRSVCWRRPKSVAYFLYIVANSVWFHFTGRMFPWIDGGYGSFQTRSGMVRALRRAGFGWAERDESSGHFVMVAK